MATNSEIQTSEVAKQTQETDQNEVTLPTKVANNEERAKSDAEKIAQLENELKHKDGALSGLKSRITQLEKDVADAQKIKTKECEEVAILKAQSEGTLVKAKEIIFENTKIIKHQELQIQALNQQVDSLKEVVSITKDLLEIRNMEVRQLETKIQCIEDRVAAEKERYELMHKKLESMIRYNGELKREYEAQLCLFSALRERYSERELAKDVLDDVRNGIADGAVANAAPVVRPDVAATNATPTVSADVAVANASPIVSPDVPATNATPIVSANVAVTNATPIVSADVAVANATPIVSADVAVANATPIVSVDDVKVANGTPPAPVTADTATAINKEANGEAQKTEETK